MIKNRYVVDEKELEKVYNRYISAMENKLELEQDWNECYNYALPQKSRFFNTGQVARKTNCDIFDSTAENDINQLAGSMPSELTPPWSKWFGFGFVVDIDEKDLDGKSEKYKGLDRIQKIFQSHFDRPNFYVKAHQCYLNLITIGTAVMLLEEKQCLGI